MSDSGNAVETENETFVLDIQPKDRFKLTDDFINGYKKIKPKWGPLGEITYRRTYSRIKADDSMEEWFETVRRVVEGCYTYQRWHCRKLGLPWNQKKAQRSAQTMYDLIFNFKFLPPGRGLWMCGTEYVEKRGSAALNNCFQYDTEIITSNGIRKIGECVGEEVELLTKGGKWIKAPINSFGEQKLMKLTLKRQGIDKIIYATPEHRWFASSRASLHRDKGFQEFFTKDLKENFRLQYMFGQGIKEIRPSSFGIAHGIAFGDGNLGHLYLCGKKDKELTKWFNLCPMTEDLNKCEDGAIRVADLPFYFKSKPNLKENKSYLYGWLAGYFAADGTVSPSGQATICSADKDNILFVRDVCSVLGIGAYSIVEENRISNLTNKPSTLYKLTLMADTLCENFFLLSSHKNNYINGDITEKRYWNVVSVEETDRIEEVFCATVEGFGAFTLADNILTGNCAFISTEEINQDFSEPFCFLMDFSMLGVGVGGDCKGAGKMVVKEPRIADEVFVVEDSREGWVSLLRRYLDAYAGKASMPKEINYDKVREYGAPIKGFGGKASGPEPLKKLMKGISESLDPLIGKPITSTAIVDIFDKIGVCVVAGNVRRSAIIMLGDKQDKEFAELKDPKLHKKEMMSHRWASNNSIFAEVGMNYTAAADSTAKNGEPGYFWLNNARTRGRMVDPETDTDLDVGGCNPCSEQQLVSHELCCLVETFPSLHDSYEEFQKTLKHAYLYAKTITLVPTHDPRTNAVVMRNRRIGTSQSGIVDAFVKHGRTNHLAWCDKGYNYLKELDKQYSDWLCVPRSKRITSVKPGGTVPLLPGVNPGIHYPHAEYYYRTIRLAKNSPLVRSLEKANYRIEQDVYDESSMVAYFPIHEKYFDRSKDDVSMWEQLSNAAAIQRFWSDNMVSITVTFNKQEGTQIKYALSCFEDQLKSVSFLPLDDHNYEQAPYQKITKDEYETAIKKLKPIDYSDAGHEKEDKFCDGDKCEIPMLKK